MQTYLYDAVATLDTAQSVDEYRVAHAGRSVGQAVTAIDGAAADGVVVDVAERVVHMQIYNHIAIAAIESRMNIQYCCIVHRGIGRTVGHQAIAIVENLAAADGIVTFGVEGVFHKQTQHCDAIAAEYAVATVGVVSRKGVNAVLVYVNLTGTDSVAQSVVVRRFNFYLVHLSFLATGNDTCVSMTFVTGLGSTIESSVGEGHVTSNGLCINQVIIAVEQTSARIVS